MLDILYLGAFIVGVVIIIPQILKFAENRFNLFSRSSTPYLSIGVIFAILLLLSFSASYLGFSGAIVAFLFGLSIQRNTIIVQDVKETFVKIGEGVFIPLFFFTVGATFGLDRSIFTLTNLLIIPLAIGAKALGAFAGTSIVGFDMKSSGQVAVGMMPRAEIVIVIAEIGLLYGIFDQQIFSMAILLVLTTVLLTPMALKLAFRQKKEESDTEQQGSGQTSWLKIKAKMRIKKEKHENEK
ncbi:MAG: cation:proton antiporter [Candidatus Heimdallarchaeota archaeon]|nr:cation:proton antiporter [Candidatus Heimdallarchaeota archaeon]